MKLIKQEFEILYLDSRVLEQIERAGRTCYQSLDKITENSAESFVAMLQKRKHTAMLEFADITVKFITNRGVTHELVRHRHCAFGQESTRYAKYNEGMEFILPEWMDESYLGEYEQDRVLDLYRKNLQGPGYAESIFLSALHRAEVTYGQLLEAGWRAEQAREELPNALKTEICVKTSVRQWLQMFELRTTKAAHPQMRALMLDLLGHLSEILPTVFGGGNIDT